MGDALYGTERAAPFGVGDISSAGRRLTDSIAEAFIRPRADRAAEEAAAERAELEAKAQANARRSSRKRSAHCTS
jgi:hypothetical protein